MKGSITPRLIVITPDVAEEFLKTNTNNRNLRRARVQRYATDMKAGMWEVTNDAISVADDGTLLNGQHRLMAVVESGCSIQTLFVEGLPRSAMGAMDTGIGRRPGDFFGRAGRGEKNASSLAATLRLLHHHASGRWGLVDGGQSSVSNAQLDQLLDDHPGIRESVAFAASIAKHFDATPREVGLAHYLIAEANDQTLADHYFRQVIQPISEPQGSAVLAVASRLRQLVRQQSRTNSVEVVTFLVRGWNRYALAKTVTQLPFKSQDMRRDIVVQKWQRPLTHIASIDTNSDGEVA